MLNTEQHLDNLIRHIDLVRNACVLLGKRLIVQGRDDFGRLLIAKGFIHDASKFHGIEWDHLHAGCDTKKDKLKQAIKQHVQTNEHHPEYWGNIEQMPEIAIAEMTCDWFARSQEFGTGLRDWIRDEAMKKYKLKANGETYQKIMGFVDLLLENQFVKP
jgi:hypothetical protein